MRLFEPEDNHLCVQINEHNRVSINVDRFETHHKVSSPFGILKLVKVGVCYVEFAFPVDQHVWICNISRFLFIDSNKIIPK